MSRKNNGRVSEYEHKLVVEAPNQPSNGERAGAGEGKLNFDDVWQAIRDGKWIILLATVLVTGAVAAYTITLAPTFEASSIVFVDTRSGVTPGLLSYGSERALSNELGILEQSADLALHVAERIRETAAAVDLNEHFPILLDAEQREVSNEDVARRLFEQVRFQMHSAQDMIEIIAESTTPQEAAVIADKYAQEYEVYSRASSRASMNATRAFLEEQVEKRRDELDEIEDQWEAFAQQKEVVALGEDGERLIAEVSELKTRRDNAQFDLEQEEATLRLVKQELARIEPSLANQLESSRTASRLETQITALDQQIATLQVQAEQYYAVHGEGLKGRESEIPELAEILKKTDHFIAQRKELTDDFIQRTTAGIEGGSSSAEVGYVSQLKSRIIETNMTIRGLQEQIAALDARLATYDSRLRGLPRQTIELKQLERKRSVAEKWYETFMEELQKTMIAQEAELGYVKIVRNAIIPTLPVRPNMNQNVILGLLLGLGFGFGLAFAKHAMNSQFQQPEDLEDSGYEVIGSIPPMDGTIKRLYGGKKEVEVQGRKVSTSVITALNPWSPISETYRLVRTNIQFTKPVGRIKMLLVTSPEMSEGKTTTAVNLAVSMAQGGRRVLLVDADLRRPNAHNLLFMPDRPGLAEALTGQTVASFGLPTLIDNLYFLPAGKTSAPPAELLDSESMLDLLRRFKESYDIVIIDSPPVLAVTDALLLAPKCDATIVVVAAHKTEQRTLRVAQRMLRSVGVSIGGVVLNQFDPKKAGYRYGYGYGYGYTASPYTHEDQQVY